MIENLCLENTVYDKIGRLHLKTPYSGPSYCFLRAQVFNSTTAVTHTTDLYNIIVNDDLLLRKPVLMLLSDNGPDFNPKSLLDTIYFYRYFKKLNLDMLTVFTFAARYSAFNCIEHLWSPLSDKLAGVTFDSVYPGDKEPPTKISQLSNSE